MFDILEWNKVFQELDLLPFSGGGTYSGRSVVINSYFQPLDLRKS
jgi:hypothetical protein